MLFFFSFLIIWIKQPHQAKIFIETFFTFFIIELEGIPANIQPSKCFILLEHFVQMSDGLLWYFCFFKTNPFPKLLSSMYVFLLLIEIGSVSFQISFTISYTTWGGPMATSNEDLDWSAMLHGHYYLLILNWASAKTNNSDKDHGGICEICLVFQSLFFQYVPLIDALEFTPAGLQIRFPLTYNIAHVAERSLCLENIFSAE